MPCSATASSSRSSSWSSADSNAAAISAAGSPKSYQGEPGHAGQCDGPAGKHGHEPPVGIEVREKPAQVALVGAEPMDEEQQAVGLAPANDVRDQRHGSLRGRVDSVLVGTNTLGGGGNPEAGVAPL
jgi:hypothetical protein